MEIPINHWASNISFLEKVFSLSRNTRELKDTGRMLVATYNSEKYRIEIKEDLISVKKQGSFFLKNYNDDHIESMRIQLRSLQEKFGISILISELNICQDYLNTTIERLIPLYHMDNIYYQFTARSKQEPVARFLNNGEIKSYYYTTSRWGFKLYRKDISITEGNEPLDKVSCYEMIYNSQDFSFPISRFEVVLKNEHCYYFLKQILQKNTKESSVLINTLQEFFNGKNIKVKPRGSKDNRKSRWYNCICFETLTNKTNEMSSYPPPTFDKNKIRIGSKSLLDSSIVRTCNQAVAEGRSVKELQDLIASQFKISKDNVKKTVPLSNILKDKHDMP